MSDEASKPFQWGTLYGMPIHECDVECGCSTRCSRLRRAVEWWADCLHEVKCYHKDDGEHAGYGRIACKGCTDNLLRVIGRKP